MDSLIPSFFYRNWQRKLVALITAIVIWMYVNYSITSTRTVLNVPVRVVNIPPGMTVQGLLPNGVLMKRVTLSLTGTKSTIEQIEPGDLEVVLDTSNVPDEWIVQINKKNLKSLNPDIDLSRNIRNVVHKEFVLKKSRLITARIPVYIVEPLGTPPPGFQYLDVWPEQLYHTVSGPEDQVQQLRMRGLKLQFNLSQITESDLKSSVSLFREETDEVSYLVPNKWKKVQIPFLNNATEEINDPGADYLQIYFLKRQQNPLQDEIPIRVFYPEKYSDTLNPDTLTLKTGGHIQEKHGITYLNLPLFASDVSRIFLDVIRDNYEIVISAAPKNVEEKLRWSVVFIDPVALENHYISLFGQVVPVDVDDDPDGTLREEMLRNRFREYLQKFALYHEKGDKLELSSWIQDNKIIVQENG